MSKIYHNGQYYANQLVISTTKEDYNNNHDAYDNTDNFYIIDDDDPEVEEGIKSTLSMFTDIGVCGDSYTAGAIYVDGTSHNQMTTTWGKILGRINGVNVGVYARNGASTKNFIEWSECLSKLLNESPKQLYIMCLGINDYNQRGDFSLGTINDIKTDYKNNPGTFYGYYGKIIDQIKAHAPGCKFIFVKSFMVLYSSGLPSAYYTYTSRAIEEIANHYNSVCIDTADSDFFTSQSYLEDRNAATSHPTAPMYAAMAVELTNLIDKAIFENYKNFKDILLDDSNVKCNWRVKDSMLVETPNIRIRREGRMVVANINCQLNQKITAKTSTAIFTVDTNKPFFRSTAVVWAGGNGVMLQAGKLDIDTDGIVYALFNNDVPAQYYIQGTLVWFLDEN